MREKKICKDLQIDYAEKEIFNLDCREESDWQKEERVVFSATASN